MSKTLTISVAAYNIEKYIHNMMESLINADCIGDLEILIVDDGSKDNTAALAKEYENRFPESVKLVSKENGGHGSTINKGIELATGKYFRALDGDDWVDSDNLNELVKTLKILDVDMVICDYNKCYSSGKKETIRFNNLQPMIQYSIDDAIRHVSLILYHAILYKTEVLKHNHIKLDENCFYVDTEYDFFAIPYIKTIMYYNKPVYCYRLGIDGQSVSKESKKKNINQSLIVAKRLLDFYILEKSNVSEVIREYLQYGVADHCIWHIRSLLLFPYSFSMQKKIRDFDNMVKDCSFEIYKNMEKHESNSVIISVMRRTSYFAYWIIKLYKDIKNSY